MTSQNELETAARTATVAWLRKLALVEDEILRKVRAFEAQLRKEHEGDDDGLRAQAAAAVEAAQAAGSSIWMPIGLDLMPGESIQDEYVCPRCGGPVTTGLLGEEYDHWLILPHCANGACSLEAGSEKDPFDTFTRVKKDPE